VRDSSAPAAGADASAELADLGFQQPPAFAAKFLRPGRIEAGKTRAEGRLIDFVERNPARDEGVAQAGLSSSCSFRCWRTYLQALRSNLS
jgi:hypothetical protein